jgi:hypothetical protein
MLLLVSRDEEGGHTRRYLSEYCDSIPVAYVPLQLSLALPALVSIQDGTCCSDTIGNLSPPAAVASVP